MIAEVQMISFVHVTGLFSVLRRRSPARALAEDVCIGAAVNM
jgi:hypothetical protein